MVLLTRPDLPATSTRATLNNHTVVMVVRRAPALECEVEVKHGRSLAQGRSGVNGWGYMLRPGQKNHTRMPWSRANFREQEFAYGKRMEEESFFISLNRPIRTAPNCFRFTLAASHFASAQQNLCANWYNQRQRVATE